MVVGSRQSSNDCIFYLCTLFQGKTEGVRDLKSDTSAYLLERGVFFPQRGIKSRMFFSFFFLVILHHCAPPSSLKTMHILPGESSNITTLLHRYSSLGSFTFSHPFSLSSPFLFSALPPPRLLVCFPVRRPSFHVLPTPCALRSSLPPSLVLYLATFTSAARGALLPSFSYLLSPSPSICICECLFWSRGPQQIFNINEDPHEFLSSN